MTVSALGLFGETAAFQVGLVATGIFLAVAAGIACLAWWLMARVGTARGQGPAALFSSLCEVHGLTWSDRRLLCRLAQWRGLADPGRLFVEPRYFEGSLADSPLGSQAERLAALRQQLFAA